MSTAMISAREVFSTMPAQGGRYEMPHPPPRMDPHCERERGRGGGRGKGGSEGGREGKGREGKGREGKGREGKGREGKGREGGREDIIVLIFAVGGPFFDAEYYHTHDHLGYIRADPNATVAAQSMYVPPSMFNLPPPPPQHYQQVSGTTSGLLGYHWSR